VNIRFNIILAKIESFINGYGQNFCMNRKHVTNFYKIDSIKNCDNLIFYKTNDNRFVIIESAEEFDKFLSIREVGI